jgi:hypothetical protein
MAGSGKERLWQFKWHYFLLSLLIAGLVVAAAGEIVVLRTGRADLTAQLLWVVGGAVFGAAILMAVFAILLLTRELVSSIKANNQKLDGVMEILNKNRAVMTQISRYGRISETAKAVVLRDSDSQALREAVLEKLYQQDFEASDVLIDQIAARPEFRALAQQLRVEADKYRHAGEQERISQIVGHIEKLFEEYRWVEARAEVERLAKVYGESEKVAAVRQKLVEKKEQRKKELLQAWDEAVKRRETDRSLEVLKELDLYLTPNEGLALQESARDVFRTKLHNLGVQFSLAVADRQWDSALQTGQQIARDFPNSRMAQEIRERLDVLRQRATKGA